MATKLPCCQGSGPFCSRALPPDGLPSPTSYEQQERRLPLPHRAWQSSWLNIQANGSRVLPSEDGGELSGAFCNVTLRVQGPLSSAPTDTVVPSLRPPQQCLSHACFPGQVLMTVLGVPQGDSARSPLCGPSFTCESLVAASRTPILPPTDRLLQKTWTSSTVPLKILPASAQGRVYGVFATVALHPRGPQSALSSRHCHGSALSPLWKSESELDPTGLPPRCQQGWFFLRLKWGKTFPPPSSFSRCGTPTHGPFSLPPVVARSFSCHPPLLTRTLVPCLGSQDRAND